MPKVALQRPRMSGVGHLPRGATLVSKEESRLWKRSCTKCDTDHTVVNPDPKYSRVYYKASSLANGQWTEGGSASRTK